MRRSILGVFFLLAACGGGVSNPRTDAVNPSADMRAAYQKFLLTADARAVIASFAKAFSQDALDTCLNAWVDDVGNSSGLHEPVAKPDVVGFRRFLSDCLGGPAPGDARTSGSGDARISRAGDARALRNVDLRISTSGDVRSTSNL